MDRKIIVIYSAQGIFEDIPLNTFVQLNSQLKLVATAKAPENKAI